MKKLAKLSEIDRKKIVDLRPWLGGHQFLHALHDLDRVGKHHGLVLSHGSQQISIGGRTYDMLGWGNPTVAENCGFDGESVARIVIWNVELLPGPRKLICQGSGASAPITPLFGLHYSNPEAVNGWNVFWALREFVNAVRQVFSLFS